MKYIFYFLFIVIISSCSKTSRVDKLIREELKSSLNNPESYKSIGTELDSAFTPYDNPILFEEMEVIYKADSEIVTLESEMKQAKSLMTIGKRNNSHSFNYGLQKAKYDVANNKILRLRNKIFEQCEKIMHLLQEKRKFIGYKAEHKYRAENDAGKMVVNKTLFFIDKDFREILYSIDVDKYNMLQEDIRDTEEEIKLAN